MNDPAGNPAEFDTVDSYDEEAQDQADAEDYVSKHGICAAVTQLAYMETYYGDSDLIDA